MWLWGWGDLPFECSDGDFIHMQKQKFHFGTTGESRSGIQSPSSTWLVFPLVAPYSCHLIPKVPIHTIIGPVFRLWETFRQVSKVKTIGADALCNRVRQLGSIDGQRSLSSWRTTRSKINAQICECASSPHSPVRSSLFCGTPFWAETVLDCRPARSRIDHDYQTWSNSVRYCTLCNGGFD